MYPGKRDGFKGRWMDGPDINEEKDAQKDELSDGQLDGNFRHQQEIRNHVA